MTALVTMMLAALVSGTAARVSMIQSRACYYQRHNRELVCQCREDNTFLHLKLREFVNARQEVRTFDKNFIYLTSKKSPRRFVFLKFSLICQKVNIFSRKGNCNHSQNDSHVHLCEH